MSTNAANPQPNTGIPGLPLPVGFDESTGQPYWLDQQGQKIYWQQMQQYMWMLQQQKQSTGGGKGPEAINMPQMPQIYTGQVAETGLEQNIERGPSSPEKSAEKQVDAQSSQTPQAQTSTQTNDSHSGSAKSYLGASPKLTKLSTADVESMRSFVTANHAAPPSSSNRFLAELVKKVLHMLSVSHS